LFSQLPPLAKLSGAELIAESQEQILKEREDETSQLNRLDGLTFLFAYFPISAVLLGVAFIFRFDSFFVSIIKASAQSFC
jgi:hypothetical protein